MQNSPLISVLLPTYNCDKYINECIDSILCQTYSNFELLIIDNCSTDNTVNLIKEYKDERIKLTVKEKNSGIVDSLNLGIDNCKGVFIARMDGDDVCMPTRFEEQIRVLQNNSAISICGSWALILGSSNTMVVPETNEQIFKKFLFQNAIIHPSLMFRKEVFKDYKYDINFEPAEDFNLWSKLIFNFNFYNIQKPLLFYRKHDENVSKKRQEAQRNKFLESQYNFYKKIISKRIIVDFNEFYNFYFSENVNKNNFIKFYKLYNQLKNYIKINLSLEASKLKTNALYRYLQITGFTTAIQVFFYLTFFDKLRFMKYYTLKHCRPKAFQKV